MALFLAYYNFCRVAWLNCIRAGKRKRKSARHAEVRTACFCHRSWVDRDGVFVCGREQVIAWADMPEPYAR